jgi:Ca2+-binding EF-hand superfamily protein
VGDLDEDTEEFEKILSAVIDEQKEDIDKIVGGNPFFSGEEDLNWSWPQSGRSLLSGAGISRENHNLSRESTSMKSCTFSSTIDPFKPSSSLSIWSAANSSTSFLPRAKPHQNPISGSTSTLHSSAPIEIFHPLFAQGGMGTEVSVCSIVGGGSRSSNRDEAKDQWLKKPPVDDEKWSSRQASVSCLMARSARSRKNAPIDDDDDVFESTDDIQKTQPKTYLDFESWGIDDAYVKSLLITAGHADLSRIRHLNLADNRITEKCVAALAGSGTSLSSVETINLAGNQLGEEGCRKIAEFIENAKPRLLELNLQGNLMGDKACEELCNALSGYARMLKVLDMARNNLGLSARSGIALGGMVGDLAELQALDLHWNQFQGAGATALCHGIYDNSCTITGKLRRLDFSWNLLGLQCANSQRTEVNGDQVSTCSCSKCAAALRTAKILSSVFQEGHVLFHVDLSHNALSAAFCSILADGLRNNHTLFGLHLSGNAASVDDLGFVVPRQGASATAEQCWQDFEVDEQVNSAVRSIPRCLKKTRQSVAHNAEVDFACSWIQSSWATVQRNVDRCWICENWCNQEVTYFPGISGSEDPDEVTDVFCFFSIDGFQKPTALTRTEEAYNRRLFQGRLNHVRTSGSLMSLESAPTGNLMQRGSSRGSLAQPSRISKRASFKELLPTRPNGKIVVYSGSRVLPPSRDPIEIVFQVDGGNFKAALDLPMLELPTPRTVSREATSNTARFNSRRRSVTNRSSSEGSAVMEITHVNTLKVCRTALERYEQSSGTGLCVLEEAAKRGDVSVYPRRAHHEAVARGPQIHWTFENSSFQNCTRDTDELYWQCFDNDWNFSKLEAFSKDPWYQEELKDFLRSKYKYLVSVFHQRAFLDVSDPHYPVFVNKTAFTDVLKKYDASDNVSLKAPTSVSRNVSTRSLRPLNRRLLDGLALAVHIVDTIFVVANVLSENQKLLCQSEGLTAVPEKGLARFQFLEAFVRVINRRFIDSGEMENPAEAVQEYLAMNSFGEDCLELRRSLRDCLFNEECCLVYKEHMPLLESLYERYKNVKPFPGRPGKFTYAAWLKFLNDADAAECGFTTKQYGLAFALGRDLRVDELSSMRGMEISLSEFFVCLAAVVRLRDDFERDFFSDMLSDFFSEHLAEVENNVGPQNAVTNKRGSVTAVADPSVAKVIALVERIFKDADEDGDRTLSVREFRRCLHQPAVLEEIEENGIEIGDFNVFFRQLDIDHSGKVSMEELCEGMIKLKVLMQGVSHAVAYLRRVFSEKDVDDSGTLDLTEFRALCSDPSVIKKLKTMGISVDEIEALFEEMVSECSGEDFEDNGSTGVSEDHMISVFLRMRDPDLGSKRGLNFLRQIFVEADVDRSGSLTRDEYRTTFLNERVSKRLDKLGLKIPDWMGMFDALDINGSKDLSMSELLQGMRTFWEAELEKNLRRCLHVARDDHGFCNKQLLEFATGGKK